MWVAHTLKHCYGQKISGETFSSQASAKDRCSQLADCWGVYDQGCDESSNDVFLCDRNQITAVSSLSYSGRSCVFEKVQVDVCTNVAGGVSSKYPCTCGATTAATTQCSSGEVCTASSDSDGVCQSLESDCKPWLRPFAASKSCPDNASRQGHSCVCDSGYCATHDRLQCSAPCPSAVEHAQGDEFSCSNPKGPPCPAGSNCHPASKKCVCNALA